MQIYFNGLTLDILGRGMFVPNKSFFEAIDAIPENELLQVNKGAWKVRKACEQIMSVHNNMSEGKANIFFDAHLRYSVAKAVCSATWKRIQQH